MISSAEDCGPVRDDGDEIAFGCVAVGIVRGLGDFQAQARPRPALYARDRSADP